MNNLSKDNGEITGKNFVVVQRRNTIITAMVFNPLALISETMVILRDLTAQGASGKINLTNQKVTKSHTSKI